MGTIIKKVGASGFDYTTIAEALASLPSDFVAAGNAYRIQLANQIHPAFTVPAFTTDATHNLTFEPIPGHGYRQNANFGSSPLDYIPANGATIQDSQQSNGVIKIYSSGVVFDGLQIGNSYQDYNALVVDSAYQTGPEFKNCIIQGAGRAVVWTFANANIHDCLIISNLNADNGWSGIQLQSGNPLVYGNTVVAKVAQTTGTGIAGAYSSQSARNNLVFGFGKPIGANDGSAAGTMFNADGHNASDAATFPDAMTNSLTGLSPTDVFMGYGPGNWDFRIKAGSPTINMGTTNGITNNVSINGLDRSATGSAYDIGAWEWQAAPVAPSAPALNAVTNTSLPSDDPVMLHVDFSAAAATGGANLDTVRVTISPADSAGHTTESFAIDSTSVNLTVAAGQTYTLSVATHNSAGYSAESNQVQIVVLAAVPVDTTPPVLVSASSWAASSVTLEYNEALGQTAPALSAYSIPGHTIGSILMTSKKVFLYNITPPMASAENLTISYTPPASNPIQDLSHNLAAALTNQAITNTIPPAPSTQGIVVKTYGTGPSYDFHSIADIATWLNSYDVVAGSAPVQIWLYENLAWGSTNLNPPTANDSYTVTVMAAPGYGFSDIESETVAGAYGTVGVEITVAGGQANGMMVQGCRINASGNTGFTFAKNNGQALTEVSIGLRRCRFKYGGPGSPIISGYGAGRAKYVDTLFIIDTGPTVNTNGMIQSQYYVTMDRCTVVRLNGAIGGCVATYGYGQNKFYNSAFAGCGDNPFNSNSSSSLGASEVVACYTDTAPAIAVPGLTYTSKALFQSATNYRPADGSDLIGNASTAKGQSYNAASTLDNNGNNRGLVPDVGAFQLAYVTPLVAATITTWGQDGESVYYTGTWDNDATSGTLELEPDPAYANNPASYLGPVAITLNPDGTYGVEADDLAPGYYIPVLTFNNAGGSAVVAGAVRFDLNGVGGNLSDTTGAASEGDVPDATALLASLSATTGLVGQTVTITFTVNGKLPGNTQITLSDNGAEGLFTPSMVTMTNGQSVTATYSPSTAGTVSLSFDNDQGLINPPVKQYTATQLPAPTLAINTQESMMLVGDVLTASGVVNLQSDGSGTLQAFFDALQGTTTGPFAVTVTGNTWSFQHITPTGAFALRLVAKANNRTTTVATNTLTVRTLAGALAFPTN